MQSLVTIIRNLFMGTCFIAVALYLLGCDIFGYHMPWPGGFWNYFFGCISLGYGVMRIWMYKRGS